LRPRRIVLLYRGPLNADVRQQLTVASRVSWIQAVAFAGAVVTCGCATSSHRDPDRRAGYEATALTLGRTEYVSPDAGYDAKWTPIGKGADHVLSSAEITRLNTDIHACVSELSKGTLALPSEAVRAAQVITCMEPRGWHVTVNEVLIVID
jgi:hypothetical protein